MINYSYSSTLFRLLSVPLCKTKELVETVKNLRSVIKRERTAKPSRKQFQARFRLFLQSLKLSKSR